jgi:hypothetical protein
VFTFTGLGWVGPVLTVVAGMFSGFFGAAYVSPTFGGAMFCAAAGVLLAAVISSLVGRTLNTRVTADGRVLHNRHTVDGLPLQDWWVIGAFYAVVCVVAGLWSIIGFRGILLGAGLLVLALIVVRWRRRPADPAARTADRTKIARERGWQVDRPAREVVDHWARRPHEQDHLVLRHGLTGELEGFPVTVFDTRPPRPWPGNPPQPKVARTVCVVRLPTAYPRVQVREVWRDDDGRIDDGVFRQPPYAELRGTGELRQRIDRPRVPDLGAYGDPAAAWVLTPEVLRVTSDRGLAGWRLEGHDLALVLVGESFRSNAVVMATLHGLAELARTLPPGRTEPADTRAG